MPRAIRGLRVGVSEEPLETMTLGCLDRGARLVANRLGRQNSTGRGQ